VLVVFNPAPLTVVVVPSARLSGGFTDTSSTTSARDAWRVTDTDVKRRPVASEYRFVQVPSTRRPIERASAVDRGRAGRRGGDDAPPWPAPAASCRRYLYHNEGLSAGTRAERQTSFGVLGPILAQRCC
jgi:hypothetical protein